MVASWQLYTHFFKNDRSTYKNLELRLLISLDMLVVVKSFQFYALLALLLHVNSIRIGGMTWGWGNDVSSSYDNSQGVAKKKLFNINKNLENLEDPYITDEQISVHETSYNTKKNLNIDSEIEMKKKLSNVKSKSHPVQINSGWLQRIPKVNMVLDPIINFKTKQRFIMLGTCFTFGIDYLSDLANWRFHCSAEDTLVGGRFSLRGSELGWAKSWMLNLGVGEASSVKFKLRMGLNLKNYQGYARLRFRTEPVSPSMDAEGLSCIGKVQISKIPILSLGFFYSLYFDF